MKLATRCKNCHASIQLKRRYQDRGELAREQGDYLKLQCKECLIIESYHVNQIRASEHKVIGLVALLVFLFGTAIIIYFLWPYLLLPNNPQNSLVISGMLLIPIIIFVIIKRGESNKVNLFNSYKV